MAQSWSRTFRHRQITQSWGIGRCQRSLECRIVSQNLIGSAHTVHDSSYNEQGWDRDESDARSSSYITTSDRFFSALSVP